MMHYGGMHYGMWGFGWVFQIIILILFFLVLWWVLRGQQQFGYRASGETAEEILKKRLAAGEIDDREFRRIKKELEE